MVIALLFRTFHRREYSLPSFREITKCLGYELNRKFMLCQWYAPLMAALVEKASDLGNRLVDAPTFANQRGGRFVIVAADG